MKQICIKVDGKYKQVSAERVYKKECGCVLNNELMKEARDKLKEIQLSNPTEKYHLSATNGVLTVPDNDFYQAQPGKPRLSGLDSCTIEVYKLN